MLNVTSQLDGAICVYDLFGRCLYTESNTHSTVHIQLPQTGIYVVKIGQEYIEKVFVR